jgi:hypothetical protein
VGAPSRPRGPFGFSAFYTYANNGDEHLGYQPEFQPQGALDLAAERGPSSQSPRHKLILTGIWSPVGRLFQVGAQLDFQVCSDGERP